MKVKKYIKKSKVGVGKNYFVSLKRRRRKIHRSLQSMLQEFLATGISAAGISHVVTANSLPRRLLWIFALTMIFLTMIYMTYSVLQEYSKYPVVMRTKKLSMKEMEFPAVTVCGFNLIPRHNVRRAGFQYMEDMKEVLESLPRYKINKTEKVHCLKDQLCRWSRFLDKCYCNKNACKSTECYSLKNSSVCACSKALCSTLVSQGSNNTCSINEAEDEKECLCKNLQYHKYVKSATRLTPDFMEALEHLDVAPSIKNLLIHLKKATSNTLHDIQDHIKPNITIRENYGQPFESIVLSCTFGSHPCDLSRDVTALYSPTYGKCYVFNYAGVQYAQAQPKIVKNPGKLQGIQLLLRNSKSDTLPLFTHQYGARVIIHEPRSLPFASESGFDIRAGDMTSVRLKYREVNRLGPPWGNCAYDGDNNTSSYLEIPYNKLGCRKKCLNDFVFKRCKCYYSFFLTGSVIPNRNFICKWNDSCISGMWSRNFWKTFSIRCPPPCKEKLYSRVISTSKMNTEFFRLLKLAVSLKLVNGSPAVKDTNFNFGMMGLEVYFGSFSITNRSESSIYSWEFLVSNVGGNLGLFLGLSLVTFVEIADFIIDIFVQKFFRKNIR